MKLRQHLQHTLHNRRAQLLLPAVLLLPLFVLVIYLLVEVTKVSIAKVRHQFALDNSAYTQMTTVSVFLNAVGLLNGPLPYRVLKTYDTELKGVFAEKSYRDSQKWNVFDLFFQAGAVPTVAPDYDKNARSNPPPQPASLDWGVHYLKRGNWSEEEQKNYDRSDWEKENPGKVEDRVTLMNKEMVNLHYVPAKQVGIPAISAYLTTYIQVSDIFNLQKHSYEKMTKNAQIFREGYFLNVDDCKKNQCARQSAARLIPYLSIPTKRQEVENIRLYISASDMEGGTGGAIPLELSMGADFHTDPLFLFAYLTPAARNRLRTLQKGVLLKQNFPLRSNHFNINLEAKYKPYVRTTVVLSCPRAGNNCVWPNPLPKYSVSLRP